MTVPIIDGIDYNTWEYRTVYEHGHHFRGIFEWGMLYKENELPEKEKKKRNHESEPYKYVFTKIIMITYDMLLVSQIHTGGVCICRMQYIYVHLLLQTILSK